MDKIENFLKEPSMEKLERLRKSEIIKIGEKLELNVENSMRKHELVREIARHMVDENVFEEAVLKELPTEMIRMTPEQTELEKIKIQAQMELQRNKMELEKVKIQQETRLREVDLAIRGRKGSHDSFEVTKQARLVPKFEEANVDGYFAHFERTALNLGWPKECWSMLLQTVLTGKAQRAYATLPTENCADYDLVKAAVLKSFELVPEAYRQKFRTQRKTENQSYVEFLREKENALDKWCDSKRIDGDVEKLRQLILAEEFLNCVPEEVRVHLSERRPDLKSADLFPRNLFLNFNLNIVIVTITIWPINSGVLTFSLLPHLSSSLTDSLPSLNLLCHSKTDARFMQDGRKAV